jgi:hypothetical protein
MVRPKTAEGLLFKQAFIDTAIIIGSISLSFLVQPWVDGLPRIFVSLGICITLLFVHSSYQKARNKSA